MKITPEQLRDILMQRPERITNGILEKRPLLMQARDRVMRWNDKSFSSSNDPIEKMRDRLFLVFDAVVKIDEEHPRSLKKAKLELKALGFSNEQVDRLGQMAIQTTINVFYRNFFSDDKEINTIADQVRENYPGYSYFWNDDAFLGTGILITEYVGDEGSLYGSVSNSELKEKGWPTHNSAFLSEEQEQSVADFLLETITELLNEQELTPSTTNQLTQHFIK